jgi:hypothetical protein
MNRELSDTSPEMARRHRDALAALSGDERVQMACEMFETARVLVLSGLPDEIRTDPIESRVHLLKRFYGRDLDPVLLESIVQDVRSGRGSAGARAAP